MKPGIYWAQHKDATGRPMERVKVEDGDTRAWFIQDGVEDFAIEDLKFGPPIAPCPYCGSQDLRLFYSNPVPFPQPGVHWYVECDECEATGGHGKTQEEAIAKWDTRFPPGDYAQERLELMNCLRQIYGMRWKVLNGAHEPATIGLVNYLYCPFCNRLLRHGHDAGCSWPDAIQTVRRLMRKMGMKVPN